MKYLTDRERRLLSSLRDDKLSFERTYPDKIYTRDHAATFLAGKDSMGTVDFLVDRFFDPEEPSQPQQRNEAGLRYDADKFRYDLIPGDALDSLAQVYTVGAKKYADRNWEKGMSWGRCFGSLMRHSWAFWRGENNDAETGLPHMAHVAWNAFALLSYSIRKTGTDDRVVK